MSKLPIHVVKGSCHLVRAVAQHSCRQYPARFAERLAESYDTLLAERMKPATRGCVLQALQFSTSDHPHTMPQRKLPRSQDVKDELEPSQILHPAKFDDPWEDAHMEDVIMYLAKDKRLRVPEEWHGPVMLAISCLPQFQSKQGS